MGGVLTFKANQEGHDFRLKFLSYTKGTNLLLLTANSPSCKLTAVTLPAILFGGLIATFLGTAFHLIRGGGFGQLFIYILLSWIGFWGGHFLSEQLDFSLINLGSLNLGTAILASILLMIIGNWVLIGKKPPDS